MVFSPVIELGADAAHTQYRLYYTVGDMGAGQFLNTTRTKKAQNVNVMEGKVLLLNSENDADAGQDGWIPDDNPFFDGAPITPKDYVFTSGHRNAQGLVWGSVAGNDILYIQGKKELRKPLLVQLYDVYGRMLKEETRFRNDFPVDVSFFRPGTYLLKLYNGYEMEVQIEKFIKK